MEGLVGYLLPGARALARVRESAPMGLYSPESFSHPAALPELAAGIDKGLIVFGSVWDEGACRGASRRDGQPGRARECSRIIARD